MNAVRSWAGGIVVVAVSIAIGCTVQGRGRPVEPVGYVEITSAPVGDIRRSPQTTYDGRVVYYVDGRWGYPRGNQWVYYRSEPPPLARHRTAVQSAPPASSTYAPAPATRPGGRRPPASAPPATRTR
jgi:hypothetical protein